MSDRALMEGRVIQVMSRVRDGSGSRAEREDFKHGSAGTSDWALSWEVRKGSTAVDGERGGAEQVLKGPAAGEMEADAAGGAADASADFEELGAESFDLGGAPRLGQLQTKEVDQVVGGGVQEQAEGVGQKAVTAQAVGAKAVLELLDAVLALAAIVVESEDFGGASGAVGNHEAQVGSGGGVLGLVADAAQARPTAGAVRETGEAALRKLGAAIAPF